MSRVKREIRRPTVGGHAIKINGKNLNIHFARIAYRCADCLGTLEIHNAGVRCKKDHDHRGFIRKDDVKKIREQQAQNIESLEEFYQIIDGKVVIK